MVGITKRLADFVKDLKYENLPQDLVNKLKISLLDTIGCAIGGAYTEEIIKLKNGMVEGDDCGNSTVWGYGIHTSLNTAITINAAMSHALELDDLHKPSKVHPGTIIVPTVLTVGELEKITGKQLLTAMAAGYEVMIRIAKGVGTSSHRHRGWHATSTCGGFGAAAAISKIYNLDEYWIANALGLAGTQAGGLHAYINDGSMCKRFHAGKAAQNGLQAARLARAGFTGPTVILEAKDGGFCRATSDDYNLDAIIEGLGEEFLSKEIGLKYYACCGHTHQAIDAVLTLKKLHNIKIQDIEDIEVRTYDISGITWGFSRPPKNTVEGQFNFPYVVAVALYDGCVFLPQFSIERMNDASVNSLAHKVRVVTDSKLTSLYPKRWCSEVTISMINGEKYNMLAEGAKGDPEKPLTMAEVQNKFKSLCNGHIDTIIQEKIMELVENIDELDNVYELVSLLHKF